MKIVVNMVNKDILDLIVILQVIQLKKFVKLLKEVNIDISLQKVNILLNIIYVIGIILKNL